MKLSKIQLEALDSLLRLDNETDAPGYLGEYREPTRKRLRVAGLVDYELIETYTWGGAHRPRPRLYRLTMAGKAVVTKMRAEKAERFEALMGGANIEPFKPADLHISNPSQRARELRR